jgi:polysaccharide export outer membrane protein
MNLWDAIRHKFVIVIVCLLGSGLVACGPAELPRGAAGPGAPTPEYVVGAGDTLEIFVWRNPELSVTAPVRPDGRFSMPLIDDLPATGRTPTQLARVIEDRLGQFIQDPLVTVIVTDFVGPFTEQVRVVGEAAQPQALAYRADMTALDAMIAVGGLTEFAAGNRATLVRVVDGEHKEFRVRLDDLLNDGDMSANVEMRPGDVLVVPETFF